MEPIFEKGTDHSSMDEARILLVICYSWMPFFSISWRASHDWLYCAGWIVVMGKLMHLFSRAEFWTHLLESLTPLSALFLRYLNFIANSVICWLHRVWVSLAVLFVVGTCKDFYCCLWMPHDSWLVTFLSIFVLD